MHGGILLPPKHKIIYVSMQHMYGLNRVTFKRLKLHLCWKIIGAIPPHMTASLLKLLHLQPISMTHHFVPSQRTISRKWVHFCSGTCKAWESLTINHERAIMQHHSLASTVFVDIRNTCFVAKCGLLVIIMIAINWTYVVTLKQT